MVESRRPRVIKTRSTAPREQPDAVLARQAEQPNPAEDPKRDTAGTGPAAVLGTSSKVSVVPLETSHEPVPGPSAVEEATGAATAETTGERKVSTVRGAAIAKLRRPGKATGESKPRPASAKAAPSQAPLPRGGAGPASSIGRESEPSGETSAQVLAFPLPMYKRKRRMLLLSLAAVVAVLAVIMALALFTPALSVQTVVFDGQKLVAPETLQKAVEPVKNKPLPQVTEGEVQQLLGSVIQVKSSRIEARPPHTLLVHIVERVPVALLKNGEQYLLVDQDGVQLGSTTDPASAALPLIDGGTAAIGQDTFRAMTAVLANLPQSILSQLANATAASPDAVELKLADGRSVVWGNASDMTLKAQVLEALLNAPPPTASPGKPAPAPAKVFDVSAPRHPVTR